MANKNVSTAFLPIPRDQIVSGYFQITAPDGETVVFESPVYDNLTYQDMFINLNHWCSQVKENLISLLVVWFFGLRRQCDFTEIFTWQSAWFDFVSRLSRGRRGVLRTHVYLALTSACYCSGNPAQFLSQSCYQDQPRNYILSGITRRRTANAAVLIVAGFVAAWIPFPPKIRFNVWRAIVSVIVFGGLIFMGLPYKLIIFGLDWGGRLGKLMLMGWAIPVFVVWLGYELGQSFRAPESDNKVQ